MNLPSYGLNSRVDCSLKPWMATSIGQLFKTLFDPDEAQTIMQLMK